MAEGLTKHTTLIRYYFNDTTNVMILKICKYLLGYFEKRQAKCQVPRSKSWTYHRQRDNNPPVEEINANLPCNWFNLMPSAMNATMIPVVVAPSFLLFFFSSSSSVFSLCFALLISIHFIFFSLFEYLLIQLHVRMRTREWIHFCTSLIRFFFVADSFYLLLLLLFVFSSSFGFHSMED